MYHSLTLPANDMTGKQLVSLLSRDLGCHLSPLSSSTGVTESQLSLKGFRFRKNGIDIFTVSDVTSDSDGRDVIIVRALKQQTIERQSEAASIMMTAGFRKLTTREITKIVS